MGGNSYTVKDSEFELFDHGTFQFKLADLKKVENNWYDPEKDAPEDKDQWEWDFEELHTGQRFRKWTSMSITTRNHTGQLLTALGLDLESGEEIDDDDILGLVGNECMISLTHEPKKTDASTMTNYMATAKRVTKKKARPAPADSLE